MTRPAQIAERMRWMAALVGAAVLALLVGLTLAVTSGQPGSSSPSALSAGGSSAPLDPRIATLAERHPGHVVQAIVQFNATVTGARAEADARAHGRIIGRLPIIHGLAVETSAAQAQALAANSDVHAVSLNTTVAPQSVSIPGLPGSRRTPGSRRVPSDQLQTTYNQSLNVTPLWKYGVTGTGVGVAVIDTGIDGALPDFAAARGDRSRVIVTAVDNPHATTATDGYGHGTDVAGIIAGNGNNRADALHGQYVGVAPNANLISIKVADEAGATTVLDVIYGLQFAVEHQARYNIRVVNLSLSAATPQSYKTDPLDAAVEAAWMHGLVVVAAAGNRGSDSDAEQYAPANDPYVITVGGVDENGTPDPSDDSVASWSGRGTTQDGTQKPDVYAPAAHIVSVLAPDSVFAHSDCSGCVVAGGQYIQTSGTSMAAPAIAGLVADLLQLHPQWTPAQVKGVLTSPAVSGNAALGEPNAVKAALDFNPPVADEGLTPSELIDLSTGTVNLSLGTWSLGTWSRATGDLRPGFASSSYTCKTCAAEGGADVNSALGTWGLGTWGMATWNTVAQPGKTN